MSTPPDPKRSVSPKVTGATLGGAVATIFGIVMAHNFRSLSESDVTAITGATATILAFAFGYIVRDPLRR